MRLICCSIMWYRARWSFGSIDIDARRELELQIEVDVAWYLMIALPINLMNISAVTIFFLARVVHYCTWCTLLLIPKTIGNRKKRLCVRLRSGDKHHLRKPSDRKAQISPVSETNAFLICAFRSEDFLRWCLSSERNLTHNLFFLFPIVFGINLIHFFDEKKDGAAENSIVCFGASIPCHAIWQR